MASQGEFLNIVYKNAEVDPSEDLTKLSQYVSAYSASTIDKASEVSQLVKQKDMKITIFEEEVAEINKILFSWNNKYEMQNLELNN